MKCSFFFKKMNFFPIVFIATIAGNCEASPITYTQNYNFDNKDFTQTLNPYSPALSAYTKDSQTLTLQGFDPTKLSDYDSNYNYILQDATLDFERTFDMYTKLSVVNDGSLSLTVAGRGTFALTNAFTASTSTVKGSTITESRNLQLRCSDGVLDLKGFHCSDTGSSGNTKTFEYSLADLGLSLADLTNHQDIFIDITRTVAMALDTNFHNSEVTGTFDTNSLIGGFSVTYDYIAQKKTAPTAVPEPASVVFIALGLFFLSLRRKLSKKTALLSSFFESSQLVRNYPANVGQAAHTLTEIGIP